jgi:hypothetical protein
MDTTNPSQSSLQPPVRVRKRASTTNLEEQKPEKIPRRVVIEVDDDDTWDFEDVKKMVEEERSQQRQRQKAKEAKWKKAPMVQCHVCDAPMPSYNGHCICKHEICGLCMPLDNASKPELCEKASDYEKKGIKDPRKTAGGSSGRDQGAVEAVGRREREDGAGAGGLSGEETGSASFGD